MLNSKIPNYTGAFEQLVRFIRFHFSMIYLKNWVLS